MNITLNEGASATFIDIHDNEVVNLSVDKGVVRVDEKKGQNRKQVKCRPPPRLSF